MQYRHPHYQTPPRAQAARQATRHATPIRIAGRVAFTLLALTAAQLCRGVHSAATSELASARILTALVFWLAALAAVAATHGAERRRAPRPTTGRAP